jgi:hypothetical protein
MVEYSGCGEISRPRPVRGTSEMLIKPAGDSMNRLQDVWIMAWNFEWFFVSFNDRLEQQRRRLDSGTLPNAKPSHFPSFRLHTVSLLNDRSNDEWHVLKSQEKTKDTGKPQGVKGIAPSLPNKCPLKPCILRPNNAFASQADCFWIRRIRIRVLRTPQRSCYRTCWSEENMSFWSKDSAELVPRVSLLWLVRGRSSRWTQVIAARKVGCIFLNITTAPRPRDI